MSLVLTSTDIQSCWSNHKQCKQSHILISAWQNPCNTEHDDQQLLTQFVVLFFKYHFTLISSSTLTEGGCQMPVRIVRPENFTWSPPGAAVLQAVTSPQAVGLPPPTGGNWADATKILLSKHVFPITMLREKRQIQRSLVCDFIYMKFRVGKSTGTESWGKRPGVASDCPIGSGFSDELVIKFWTR